MYYGVKDYKVRSSYIYTKDKSSISHTKQHLSLVICVIYYIVA